MPALAPVEPKHPTNLSLAPDRVRFGQQYAAANHTSLSKVVEDLLGSLEQALNQEPRTEAKDPLDGLLSGWPDLDKKELRRAQHEARLAR